MSNHFSADNLKFPGDDRRLDLTDVFAFQAPDGPGHHHGFPHRHHPGTTVLIMDSNPTSAPPPIEAQAKGPAFYPGAFYRINIDTDGDNLDTSGWISYGTPATRDAGGRASTPSGAP